MLMLDESFVLKGDVSFLQVVMYARAMIQQVLKRRGAFFLTDEEVCLFRKRLPYVFRELPGKDNYILLNREYDPVGVKRSAETQSRKYCGLTRMHVSLPKIIAQQLWVNMYDPRLFNDQSPPWSSREDLDRYYKRLSQLELLLKN